MLDEMVQDLMIGQYGKLTENGAFASESAAAGSLLDLFSAAGSLRSRPGQAASMYAAALASDRLSAVKLAFYTRDIRAGLGERMIGRIMFRTIAHLYPQIMRKNLKYVAEFGRFDDLVDLLDTKVKDDALLLLKKQLAEDIAAMGQGKPVSLLAKWLPSVNTSSCKARRKARMIAAAFGYTEKEYRKTLSALRAYLNVTEVRLSAKEYEQIDYEAIPSRAMLRYRNAFRKHDADRFEKYIADVSKGTAQIHSSVLYPYDLVHQYADCSQLYWYGLGIVKEENALIEEQWKALPSYINDEENTLVMVDVSGSMYGRPIETSMGLGIYFAERMKRMFHNRIMLFAEKPRFIELKGETLRDKLIQILSQKPGYSTDLEKAFELVLRTASANQLEQEDLPSRIVVISDNEINRLTSQTRWLFVDEMKARFEAAGYQMPSLVLWNVDSRQNTFHALYDEENVVMCSGQSLSVLRSLIDTLKMTPYEYMMHVLNNPRYDCITV